MIAAVLASFLALSAIAQEQGKFNSACFHGLNDVDSPAALPPCESQDLLNTESNLQGSEISKRKGFQLIANLAITTSAVVGSHSFIDGSGNRQDIVCVDRYCQKSTNGNAFTTFLTTATLGITRWSFVDIAGSVYGANSKRDPIFKYDGTTLSYPATMPLGSILELTQDRLVVGDISGQPNRVQYSSAGAVTQFTTGSSQFDSYFDDIGAPGDKIRGLKYSNGNLYIFKSNSITACKLGDQYSSRCAVVSPSLGTTDPASIIAVADTIYFRAQDKNYWELGPGGLRQISKKIQNLVKTQSGGSGGGENSSTQTSRGDWESGTQNPSSTWDTVTVDGSVFPSSNTFVDTGTFTTTYNLNIDTSGIAAMRLSSYTRLDTWSNGVTLGRLAWNVTSGSFSISDLGALTTPNANCSFFFSNQCTIETSSVTISSGSWAFRHLFRNTASGGSSWCDGSAGGINNERCFEFRFMQNAGEDYYSATLTNFDTANDNQHYVQLTKRVGGTLTTLAQYLYPVYAQNTSNDWEIQRSTDGRMYLYINNVFISSTVADVSITSSTKVMFAVSGRGDTQYNTFKNFYAYQQSSSGTFVSQVFDTSFSTPTFGPFGATVTAPSGEGSIYFYTHTATSSSGAWTALSAASDTTKILSAGNRYIQYRADFFTFISTKSPSLTSVSLTAATTGTLATQCIQPNSSISSWGALNCAATLVGNGSIVYYATSAATCATLPTTDPTA